MSAITIDVAELVATAEAQVLKLLPGDLLFVSFPVDLTPADGARIRAQIQAQIPEGVNILIAGKGVVAQAFRTLQPLAVVGGA
jgi:hypothetical protein